jgi:hypothetical protein
MRNFQERQMLLIEASNPASLVEQQAKCQDEIHVILQYFEHPTSKTRTEELRFCLKSLCVNPSLAKVHMLNEISYRFDCPTLKEAIKSGKLVQVRLGKRLLFQDVFTYLRTHHIQGYHVIVNSDIVLDQTIEQLRTTDMHLRKLAFAQLRYEWTGDGDSKLFGPRCDSQDCWILHSNFAIPEQCEKVFNFKFGVPGCDNKLIYLFKMLGYDVVNDPLLVKTYHVHASQERSYTAAQSIPPPYALLLPARVPIRDNISTLGVNIQDVAQLTNQFTRFTSEDHAFVARYIGDCIRHRKSFVIPRIQVGPEQSIGVYGDLMRKNNVSPAAYPSELLEFFERVKPVMKSNAGIQLTSLDSFATYSALYMKAFENSEIYGGWEPYGVAYQSIANMQQYMQQQFSAEKEKYIFSAAYVLDIYHFIYDTVTGPWTHALRGQRLLIVSPFAESFREKIAIRSKLYDGVDLFPDCTFEFLKPPQTQGQEPSADFLEELKRFYVKLDESWETFDVALVSAGGYGNIICNYIFEKGKSAVYVGGVLQMYFGVLGNRWLRDRPDVLRLFLNAHWSRPKESERPKNYSTIENACYW